MVRLIEKREEPDCLSSLRREAKRVEQTSGRQPVASDWDPRECASPIRKALCAEQMGLCAYCMSRIKPHGFREELASDGGMKIEHFRSRTDHPREMYDWENLLGVCGGVFRGHDGPVRHCDTARADRPLHVHPAKRPPNPELVFVYNKDGTITGETQDARDDLGVLNLGADHLVSNRHEVIQKIRADLRRRGGDSAAAIRRYYLTATIPGSEGLPPYAPVAVSYLVAKARQRNVALA